MTGDTQPGAMRSADILLLKDIARRQLQYASPMEAIALLQFVLRVSPRDRECMEMLVEAFIQRQDWKAADLVQEGILRLDPRGGRRYLLRQVLIAVATGRFAQARRCTQLLLGRRQAAGAMS